MFFCAIVRIIEDIVNEEELEVVDSDDVTNSWAITATAPTTNLKVFNLHYMIYTIRMLINHIFYVLCMIIWIE